MSSPISPSNASPTDKPSLDPDPPPVRGKKLRLWKLLDLKRSRRKAQKRKEQSLRDRAKNEALKEALKTDELWSEPPATPPESILWKSSARKRELRRKEQIQRRADSITRILGIRGRNDMIRAQFLAREIMIKYNVNAPQLRPVVKLWDTASADCPSRELIHSQLPEGGFMSMLLGNERWGLIHLLSRHLRHFTGYGVVAEDVCEFIGWHLARQPAVYMANGSIWYKLLMPDGSVRKAHEKNDTMYLVVIFSKRIKEGTYPILTSYPATSKRLYLERKRNHTLKKIYNGTEVAIPWSKLPQHILEKKPRRNPLRHGSRKSKTPPKEVPGFRRSPSVIEPALGSRGVRERPGIRRRRKVIPRVLPPRLHKVVPKVPKLPVIKVFSKAGETRAKGMDPAPPKIPESPATKPPLEAGETRAKETDPAPPKTPKLQITRTFYKDPTPKNSSLDDLRTYSSRSSKSLLNILGGSSTYSREPMTSKSILSWPEGTVLPDPGPKEISRDFIEPAFNKIYQEKTKVSTTTPRQPIHGAPKAEGSRKLSTFMLRRVDGLPHPISNNRRVKGLPGWRPEETPAAVADPPPKALSEHAKTATTHSTVYRSVDIKGLVPKPGIMMRRVDGLPKPDFQARRVKGLPGWELEGTSKAVRTLAELLSPRPKRSKKSRDASVPRKPPIVIPQLPDLKPQEVQAPKMLAQTPQRPASASPSTMSISTQVRSLHLKSSAINATGGISGCVFPVLSRITCRLGPRLPL